MSFLSNLSLDALFKELFRAVIWFVLLAAIFVPLERFFALRRAPFRRKAWLTDCGWFFVNSLVPVAVLGPLVAVIATAAHALLPAAATDAVAALPLGVRVVAALVVSEFGVYWGHRWSHEIPLLWRFHAIHHSAEHVDYLVNIRAHPVDMIFTRLCGLSLLYVTGLAAPAGPNAGTVALLVSIFGVIWSYFIHANVRWRFGWLEELVSTPAFHHWHHTRRDHTDHNYAATLPVMDRLFGTFYLPRAWPAEYGTDFPVPDDLGSQLLSPFGTHAADEPGAGKG